MKSNSVCEHNQPVERVLLLYKIRAEFAVLILLNLLTQKKIAPSS